jgi:hypothetical protein
MLMIPADNRWRQVLVDWWFRKRTLADALFPGLHNRVRGLLNKDDGAEEEYIELVKEINGVRQVQPEGAIPPRAATAWPLGMKADLANRKVWRNEVEADLGNSKAAWEILAKLARNYPSRTPRDALWRDDETELAAVYMNVSRLRHLIQPLGLIIPRPNGAGYVLAEGS